MTLTVCHKKAGAYPEGSPSRDMLRLFCMNLTRKHIMF